MRGEDDQRKGIRELAHGAVCTGSLQGWNEVIYIKFVTLSLTHSLFSTSIAVLYLGLCGSREQSLNHQVYFYREVDFL